MAEKDIQKEVLDAVLDHPKVAWAMVMTKGMVRGIGGGVAFHVGAYKIDKKKKNLNGMSDILGQMIDGRVLAIEVKLPGQGPTDVQYDFLDLVYRQGGVAGWCTSATEVDEIIQL